MRILIVDDEQPARERLKRLLADIEDVGSEAYPIRRTLADLEARLHPARFFRAHRSAIVNLDRVKEIVPWFKGSHKLRLTTGAEVDLSRAQARALRKILGW